MNKVALVTDVDPENGDEKPLHFAVLHPHDLGTEIEGDYTDYTDRSVIKLPDPAEALAAIQATEQYQSANQPPENQ